MKKNREKEGSGPYVSYLKIIEPPPPFFFFFPYVIVQYSTHFVRMHGRVKGDYGAARTRARDAACM